MRWGEAGKAEWHGVRRGEVGTDPTVWVGVQRAAIGP